LVALNGAVTPAPSPTAPNEEPDDTGNGNAEALTELFKLGGERGQYASHGDCALRCVVATEQLTAISHHNVQFIRD